MDKTDKDSDTGNEGLSTEKLKMLGGDERAGPIPSSDVETEQMDDMDNKASDLERLSKENKDEPDGRDENKEAGDEQKAATVNPSIGGESHIKDEKTEKSSSSESTSKKSSKRNSADLEEKVEVKRQKIEANGGEDEGNESDEEMEDAEEEKPNEEPKLNEADELKTHEEAVANEQKRTTAMHELKEIEIEFAHLKDKLYETQLKKLEFELRLCELNRHPDFLYFMKLIDENLKGRIEKSMNLQKYRLKCLDNQTKARRVQIHQQFVKSCEELKYGKIHEITADWYKINKERRQMDSTDSKLPEFYRYNSQITAQNVSNPEVIDCLVRQRNALYHEISSMEGLIKYKRVFPSSLNWLDGCSGKDQSKDMADMGI